MAALERSRPKSHLSSLCLALGLAFASVSIGGVQGFTFSNPYSSFGHGVLPIGGRSALGETPIVLKLSERTLSEDQAVSRGLNDGTSSPLTPDLYAYQAQTAVKTSDSDVAKSSVEAEGEYQRGLITVGLITLVFASMSPVMHAALSAPEGSESSVAPPVLLLNAAVSVVAWLGLVMGGPLMDSIIPLPRTLVQNQKDTGEEESKSLATRAGLELGLWKFFGTVANLYGLSLTTSAHGAFLIQLTTLIVPVVQGIMGVPIPKRIVFSIGLALAGVGLFTQDANSIATVDGAIGDGVLTGDALCVLAAVFYATYDLRLFKWGKLVPPKELIGSKIATQAFLSVLLFLGFGFDEASSFLATYDFSQSGATLALLILWSGLAVNAIVPFIQVGGQQAIGPTRAQTLYASQPLWASIMSYVFLGETVGTQGIVGGGAFLLALSLAATAEPPNPDCGKDTCEV
jgi:drug/metabolite transporter (DMT)-like permease